MKILIIEDEPSLSELIEREVISEGYVAECARDFISAETKIVGYNYDCILLKRIIGLLDNLPLHREVEEHRPQHHDRHQGDSKNKGYATRKLHIGLVILHREFISEAID